MTGTAPEASRKYDLAFVRWIYENVDQGEKMAMCMQCGTCSGSCPIGTQMDHGPRKLFMMARAGMKDEVLKSDTLWNCVSCYNCVVRCPRQVPVTYLLKAFGTLAVQEGYVEATKAENSRFAKAMIWSTEKYGRTDERLVTAKFYMSDGGFGNLIKESLANKETAQGMLKAKRMHLGLPHKIKGTGEIKKILAKAREIEARGKGED